MNNYEICDITSTLYTYLVELLENRFYVSNVCHVGEKLKKNMKKLLSIQLYQPHVVSLLPTPHFPWYVYMTQPTYRWPLMP